MIAPPIAADVDLRDYPFMPLDVARLRDSKIVDEVTGDQFRAAVLCWCSAWHQVPAGSLPDDDVQLAKFAGYGRVVKEWQKVRAGALYGFEKASDGRLYHPVIVEKALEAWAGRRSASTRGKAGAAKRWGSKDSQAIPENSSAISDDGSANGPAKPNDSNRQGQGEREGQGEEEQEARSAGADAAPPSPSVVSRETPAGDLFEIPAFLLRQQPPSAEIVPLVTQPEREIEAAVEAYNLTADFAKWPTCQVVTDKRRKALKARLSEAGGLDGWKDAMRKAAQSSFLLGKTGRSGDHAQWRPNLDFFLQQSSFTKLVEGGYDDPDRAQGGGGQLGRLAEAAAFALAAGDPTHRTG